MYVIRAESNRERAASKPESADTDTKQLPAGHVQSQG